MDAHAQGRGRGADPDRVLPERTFNTSTKKAEETTMSFQAYLDNIEEKTGLTPRQFISLAQERGFDQSSTKAATIVEWLKNDYGLGRGHAMALVHVIKNGPKIDAKHVRTTGSHRDESDTLWLDGKHNRP
jgi:hypothetical protein